MVGVGSLQERRDDPAEAGVNLRGDTEVGVVVWDLWEEILSSSLF